LALLRGSGWGGAGGLRGGGRCGLRKREEIFYGGDRDFDGTDMVAGEVVDSDAEVIGALVGNTDLLVEGNSTDIETADACGTEFCLGGGRGEDDEVSILVR
jgi:hypothetical protein